jgi:2'-hydroxyisoflavone reductase
MRVLVLGGTQFVGRHIVNAAVVNGHEVTLFNRGVTNQDLFPSLEKLIGDRDGGLDSLRDRQWDAAIDVNGYLPRLVRDSTSLLSEVVGHYTFISTLSVFAEFSTRGQKEDSPLAVIKDPTTETITGETYGALKAQCEKIVEEIMPGKTLIIRPGYVVGPYDHTDRFTSWIRRIKRGGDMLVPGYAEIPIQFIDGRDLAEFTIRQVENKGLGIFNTTGPESRLTWGTFFDECASAISAEVQFKWVSESFIDQQEISDLELPMWPHMEEVGVMSVDCSKAIASGLSFRPLAETIRDTQEWDERHGTPRAGLSPEREKQLLEAWRYKS